MALIKKTFLIFCFVCVFLLSAHFAYALELHYPTIFGHSLNDTSSLGEFVCYFFALGMDLAFLIAVIVIAWGGVQYLFTLGLGKLIDPKKGTRAPDEAKEWVKSGVYGLLIVVCAALIVNTINPNLAKCNLDFLPEIIINPFGFSTTETNATIVNFKEIPIGTLTENLLTRTTNCYGFNDYGDPVNGDQIAGPQKDPKKEKKQSEEEKKKDEEKRVYGPTYLEHDLADCITQLIDGSQKKGQMIAGLSNEITDLMNLCDCEGKCDPDCGGNCGNPTACPGGTCISPCIGGACHQPAGTNDCCPDGIKKQIEHGPVPVFVDVGGHDGLRCDSNEIEYNGLDEFRCPNPNNKDAPCSGIVGFVEKDVRVNKETITIIDQTKWHKLNLWQQLEYFKEKIEDLKSKVQKDVNVLTQAKSVLGNCYLAISSVDLVKTYESARRNEKIILTQKIFTDPETNKPADSSQYCSGFNYENSSCFTKCNDACPDTSPQALACYQKCKACDSKNSDYQKCMKEQETCIEKCYKKRPCIYGPKTSQFFYGSVDSSKDDDNNENNNENNNGDATDCTQDDIGKPCQIPDGSSGYCSSDGHCQGDGSSKYEDRTIGIAGVSADIWDAMNDGWDALGDIPGDIWDAITGGDSWGNGGGGGEEGDVGGGGGNNSNGSNGGSSSSTSDSSSCVSSCQNDLLQICAAKYEPCSSEYDFCVNQASGNSQCVLENADDCLFGAQDFKSCAQQASDRASANDQGNVDFCIDRAYLCQNGSDEFAGYQDCTVPPPRPSSCPSGEYSSSFLYSNPSCQKCPKPYEIPQKGEVCYSATADKNASCQTLCPETTKCPASSKCPTCPCDKIDDKIYFSIPNDSIGEYNTRTEPILAYQMAGPQCNGYSYNQDPLTFYCQDQWWTDPNRKGLNSDPVGDQNVCLPAGEVPVGQTVDSALNWANTLINNADSMKQYMQMMLDQMKKIGRAIGTNANYGYSETIVQNYCKCQAKKESGNPICKTDCQYYQFFDPIQGRWFCGCLFIPCKGAPCEQLTDYLQELWGYYAIFKSDFINFYTTMLTEPRSDTIKQLAYSRTKTNSCSAINSAYGEESTLLSCTRVKDEIIPPVNGRAIEYNNQKTDDYCYGKDLGELFNQSLTDNWFCCENYQTSQGGQGSGGGQGSAGQSGPPAPSWQELEKNNGRWP